MNTNSLHSAESQALADSIVRADSACAAYTQSIPVLRMSVQPAPDASEGIDSMVEAHWTLVADTTTAFKGTAGQREHASPFAARPVAYSLATDTTVGALLLFSLLLTAVIYMASWHNMCQQAKNFMLLPRSQHQMPNVETKEEKYGAVILCALMCFSAAVMTLAVHTDEITSRHGLHLLAYTGCFAGYYALRFVLYRYANWVFFDRVKNLNWNEGFSLLTSLQSGLFLALAFLTVYDGEYMPIIATMGLILLALLKIGLIFRTKVIFFSKMGGILHFIAYLCTLEVLPMLIIIKTLMYLANVLIIKF